MASYKVQINTVVDSNGQDCLHLKFNGTGLTEDGIKHVITRILDQVLPKMIEENKLLDMNRIDACVDPSTRIVVVLCPFLGFKVVHEASVQGAGKTSVVVNGSQDAVRASETLVSQVQKVATSMIA